MKLGRLLVNVGGVSTTIFCLAATIRNADGAVPDDFYHSAAGCPLFNVEQSDYSVRMKDFVRSARNAGIYIEINSCEIMYSMLCRENFSYVASCKLKDANDPALLCSSSMTNSFAISVTYESTTGGMAKFMEEHCVGG